MGVTLVMLVDLVQSQDHSWGKQRGKGGCQYPHCRGERRASTSLCVPICRGFVA